MFNCLFIGDIFGEPGRRVVEKLLPRIKRDLNVNFVVANAENAAGGLGLTEELAKELWGCGIDIITTGNHVWKRREIIPFLKKKSFVLRPANYPSGVPGCGYFLQKINNMLIGIVNLQGRVYLSDLDDPFRCLDIILRGPLREADIVVVDMHAEASSEKQALAWYFDGRVSAVLGTHTHVQTADERILPNGTAFITDLGLTGPHKSVIGVEPSVAIARFTSQQPLRIRVAKEDVRLQGALVEIDEKKYRTVKISRISYGLEM